MGEENKNTFPVWTDILSIVGVFFLTGLLTGAIVLAAGIDQSGAGLFIAYTGQFVLTIAYAVFWIRRRTGAPALVERFSLRGFDPAVILWGVLLMLVVSVVIEPVIELFPAEWYDWVGDRIKHGGWAMATAVIAAPICEEVLFRGLIQTALVRKQGPWAGILTASALFGIIHLIPQQIVAGFLLGMIIGLVYYKTRSLAAAIVLHLINNALATFLSLFESQGGSSPTLRELIGNDAVYWTIFAASALLVILSLVHVIRTIRRAGEKAEEKT
jgi:membrane protease YdiL (CAAX protease family)